MVGRRRGGAHRRRAGTTPATYRANYTEAVCQPVAGLVGAWGFDETSGTTATDASGRGNTGTISGATRTTAGKFGSALTFDGVNDLVTVAGQRVARPHARGRRSRRG